ncbi:MAG: nitrate ABC transporter ATP-binding protein [Candidatus Contendobacter odensis]|uniref:Nitrate ABC transporter ATP-binding protein n=1 Tax=Candidatus Contendibacter odensensis TaxID=1400860 RepID=A0A2G6PEW4_9GAMM|nr:MAG: nitrate ABC transporter ATP-binding protein [Candidatus Contendobacter odensis]
MLRLHDVRVDLLGETIIEHFDLQLNPAEVVCLYGPSGCGKTTILRLIARLIEAESGNVSNHFQRTTYLFQEHRLLPWLSAWDNVMLVVTNRSESQPQAEQLLTQLALSRADWRKYPHELSGGMRQRVALARALITEPDLLLMDEPFSALDYELRQALQDMILDRVSQHQMSIILVTHDRYEAARMAQMIYILDTKPAHCRSRIALTMPYARRNHAYIEHQVHQSFWQHYAQ